MRYSFFLSALFFALLLFSAGTHLQHGIVGLTQMNGEGCLCHSFSRAETVRVVISGPDSLLGGASANYIVKITGGPKVLGGFNVAARRGLLSPFDTLSQIIDGELTHRNPRAFLNDTLSYRFTYRAPTTPGNDTLFSVALSANGDGNPTDADKWNYGLPFRVKVLPVVPVELVSFSVSPMESGIVVRWVTATELNNAGFDILSRNNENADWEQVAFVKGHGTKQIPTEYSYRVNTSFSAEYRLVQHDYNGDSRTIAQSQFITPLLPNGFSVEQNFPNPFNSRTTIGYTLQDISDVHLEIFSVTGEKVYSEKFRHRTAGYNVLSVQLTDLYTGIYYYRLTAFTGEKDIYSVTRKMTYLK